MQACIKYFIKRTWEGSIFDYIDWLRVHTPVLFLCTQATRRDFNKISHIDVFWPKDKLYWKWFGLNCVFQPFPYNALIPKVFIYNNFKIV